MKLKKTFRIFILLFIAGMFLPGQAPGVEFKDMDNTTVEGKEGVFAGLNYWYANFIDTGLFDWKVGVGVGNFFSKGIMLNSGYQTKTLKAEILIGSVGYDAYTSSFTAMSGSGILLGIRLRYKTLPVFEYIFSTGNGIGEDGTTEEPMECKSIKVEMFPKKLIFDWPENEWFSKIAAYPGIGIESNWVRAGHSRDIAGVLLPLDDDENQPPNGKNVTDFLFILKADVEIYPQFTFESLLKFGLSGNVKGKVGVKYLFWGPWMEKK